ncbi:hypothetical protein [Parabacteroides chinchillae]|uniref:Uncharacterized protein n=1 Tax=Parabacteroides chinchillae TaxID=871327 RepID=A0A8G2BWC5_9BACT|nr:hypothetical protein [Parabacteroides chinchillae]SEF85893.1 hypothetical protein SAMN05444001_10896 [Parabacteroides chinchillae]
MELTLKDRVLILNNVLPMYDSRKNIGLKISVTDKIKLSDTEQKDIVTTPVGNGEFEVSFKTVDAMTGIKSFDFTDDELMYLKQRVDFIDRNGMFSAETIESYTKILDEPFVSADKQAEWNKAQGMDTEQ